VKSVVTPAFREAFRRLPGPVQRQARQAYRLFAADPSHPGLQFKKVKASADVVSVRISRSHRALGARRGDTVIWFWIGSHDDYERRIS
jgi:hypothetical protein